MRRVLFLNGSNQRATVELYLQEGDSTSNQRFAVAARPGSTMRVAYPLISNVVEVRVRPMTRITLDNGTVLHIRQPLHAPFGEEFDVAIVALRPAARGLMCGITDRGTVLTEEFA